MKNTIQPKGKRKRISKGQLVASSNELIYSCIRALDIIHYYNPLTYSRVRRVVMQSNDDDVQTKTNIILNT